MFNLNPGKKNRFVSKIIKILYPFYRGIELCISSNATTSATAPVIFIVGSPRSGTTITFQLLTRYFDVSYPDCLCSLFPNTPVFGFWISKKLFKSRVHNSFTSMHGYPLDDIRGPNEWELFFDRYLVNKPFNEIAWKKLAEDIKKIQIYEKGRPLVFKALRCSLHIEQIAKHIPNARFIFVKRNQSETEKSIYIAKKKERYPAEKMWYVVPEDAKNMEFPSEFEQIHYQVNSISKSINAVFKKLPAHQTLEIGYEEITADVISTMEKIAKKFPEINMR